MHPFREPGSKEGVKDEILNISDDSMWRIKIGVLKAALDKAIKERRQLNPADNFEAEKEGPRIFLPENFYLSEEFCTLQIIEQLLNNDGKVDILALRQNIGRMIDILLQFPMRQNQPNPSEVLSTQRQILYRAFDALRDKLDTVQVDKRVMTPDGRMHGIISAVTDTGFSILWNGANKAVSYTWDTMLSLVKEK